MTVGRSGRRAGGQVCRWALSRWRSLLPIVLLLANAPSARPQTGTRNWRPEERVVLRDYNDVLQVAATGAGVYAVTRGGLIAYDPRFGDWEPPITELDGFPETQVFRSRSTIFAPAIGDPSDESIWFGSDDAVVHYMPLIRLLDRIPLMDGVRQLMFDSSDPFRGLYVRTTSDWLFIPRGSGVPFRAFDLPPVARRITSTTVEDVLQRYPAADAIQAFTMLDGGRRYRYTSGAVDALNRIAFFGTNGLGLLRYEGLVASLERLPFGLLADGVGAVTIADGGVWVGSTRSHRPTSRYRPGFTWVSRDFQQSRVETGPGTVGFRFDAVRDIAQWGGVTWAATDAGLVRFGDGRVRIVDRSGGLPANDVLALAAAPDALWVGTARGLASIRDDGETVIDESTAVAMGAAISALQREGDSLWVGGRWGLALVAPGGTVVTVSVDADGTGFREPVASLALTDGRLVVALGARIAWRGRDRRWNTAAPLGGLGDVTTLAGDRDGVWLGGRGGVQFFRFESSGFTVAAGPGDLPGVVRDIAVSERYIWIGTDGGLVRLQRDAVLP